MGWVNPRVGLGWVDCSDLLLIFPVRVRTLPFKGDSDSGPNAGLYSSGAPEPLPLLSGGARGQRNAFFCKTIHNCICIKTV